MTSRNPYAPTISRQSAIEIDDLCQPHELTKTMSEPAKFAAGLLMVAALVLATWIAFAWLTPGGEGFKNEPPVFSLTERFILSGPPAIVLGLISAWLFRWWKHAR